MSITSKFYPYDKGNVFYDLDTWESLLGDLLRNNPEGADSLALAFYKTIRVMSDGPAGFDRALNGLKLGMEWIFPYTSTHQLSFKYFLYHMECVLSPSDYPETLLAGPIERGEKAARRVSEEDEKRAQEKKRKPGKKGKTRKVRA